MHDAPVIATGGWPLHNTVVFHRGSVRQRPSQLAAYDTFEASVEGRGGQVGQIITLLRL